MKNTIFHLSTCDTCKRILKDIDPEEHGLVVQDIKKQPITADEIEELRQLSDSYEALINKRANLYKNEKLAEQNLSEKDFKDLLLRHYTFLKRPVIVYQNQIFVGNDKKTVADLMEALKG